MIRHCVLVRLRDDSSTGSWPALMAELTRLVKALPGALTITVGSNVTPETGMDGGYSEGFVIDFADAASRDSYLVDPEHVRIGAQIIEMAQNRSEGVLVFDWEYEPS